jgi:ribosomal protein L37AE/L43A
MKVTKEARKHIADTQQHGRDLHACPVCGKVYECEAVVGPRQLHYIACAEHGQQVGVGSYFIRANAGAVSAEQRMQQPIVGQGV